MVIYGPDDQLRKCGHHGTPLAWINVEFGWRCRDCFPELFPAKVDASGSRADYSRADYQQAAAFAAMQGGSIGRWGEVASMFDEIDRLRDESRRADAHIASLAAEITRLAKIVAEQASIEAIRQTIPCPTCAADECDCVSGAVDSVTPHGYHCPGCTDGHISPERAWHIVANVFDGSPVLNPYSDTVRGDAFDHGVDATFMQLRAVRP